MFRMLLLGPAVFLESAFDNSFCRHLQLASRPRPFKIAGKKNAGQLEASGTFASNLPYGVYKVDFMLTLFRLGPPEVSAGFLPLCWFSGNWKVGINFKLVFRFC